MARLIRRVEFWCWRYRHPHLDCPEFWFYERDGVLTFGASE